jgi:hypothetical protein
MSGSGGKMPQERSSVAKTNNQDEIEEAEALRMYQESFQQKKALMSRPRAFIKAGTLNVGNTITGNEVKGELYMPKNERVDMKVAEIHRKKELEGGLAQVQATDSAFTDDKRRQLTKLLREQEALIPKPKARTFKRKVASHY